MANERTIGVVKPFFSIVIANYNYGRFLDDAIRSVIAQDVGGEVELIICDAASTDNSVEIIKKYANGLPPNTSYEEWISHADSQFTIQHPQLLTWWCSESDGGQSDAFNKGFSHARGRFLTWLNADDILTPFALQHVLEVARKYPECEWICGSSVYADASLRIVKCFCAHRFSIIRARYGFLSVWGPSSFFTKRLLNKAGGIDCKLHYLMDIDLWHRFYLYGRAKYKRTLGNLFAYRQHDESKMSGARIKPNEKNMANRIKAKAEEFLVNSTYGINSRGMMYLFAHLIAFSFYDAIISAFRTMIWKGRDAREI